MLINDGLCSKLIVNMSSQNNQATPSNKKQKHGNKNVIVVNPNDSSDLKVQLQLQKDMLDKIDKKNKDLYENIRLKEEKIILEKEKEDALSRLSKIARQKLTKGNPVITDLGNPNRPAKLGERWSSLYTDEWRDAFEELSTECKERKCDVVPEIQLMRIVDWCYKKCSALAEDQTQKIKPLMWDLACHLNLQDIQVSTEIVNRRLDGDPCPLNTEMSGTMESFVEHFICQRQNNRRLVETVKSQCTEDYKTSNPAAKSNEIKFVEKCSELCWYMLISDPPMVIDYEDMGAQEIDSNKFNKYDRTGTTIEYVVWPILLLHKNGPVLAKGTVQTNAEPERSNDEVVGLPTKCKADSTEDPFVLVKYKDGNKNDTECRGSDTNNNKDCLERNKQRDERGDECKQSDTQKLSISDSLHTKGNKVSNESKETESQNLQTNRYTKQTQMLGNIKPVEAFKKSMEDFAQNVEERKFKAGISESSSSPSYKNKMVGSNTIQEVESPLTQTSYYSKPENQGNGIKHSDSIRRSYNDILQNSKLPRQLSVDKAPSSPKKSEQSKYT